MGRLDKRKNGCYILYQDKGVLHGERAPFFMIQEKEPDAGLPALR